MDFLKYEVVTKVTTNYPNNMIFPSVTVCIDIPHKFNYIQTTFDDKRFDDKYEFPYFNLKCSTFNGGKTQANGNEKSFLVQEDYGSMYGMYLSMEVLSNDGDETNLHFLVQDNNELSPYRILSSFTFDIGQKTSIGLKKRVHDRLPSPFNDCFEKLDSPGSFGSDFYRRTFNNTFDYKRINCYELCAAIEMSDECNCSTPGLFVTNDEGTCGGETDCTRSFFRKFSYKDSCQSQCPQECDSVSFEFYRQTSVYVATQQDKEIYKRLNSNRTLNESTSLALEIFFQDLKYDKIEENDNFTILDLIANIGGTLGIFLGISFFSFTESIEFFFIVISIITNKIKGKTAKN